MTEEKKPFGLASFYRTDKGRWMLPRWKIPKRHTCLTRHCERDPRRTSGGRCSTCESRIWRANNPVAYGYWNLKNRARQRGHVFTITLADFSAIVAPNGVMLERGRHSDCLSVDRIIDSLGYVPGNIQLISVVENCRKRFAPACAQ